LTSGASLPHWGRLRRPALSLLSPPGWRPSSAGSGRPGGGREEAKNQGDKGVSVGALRTDLS